MALLSEPRPDRVTAVNGAEILSQLTIGVRTRTQDHGGRAVIPHDEVCFAIGTPDAPEAVSFSVPPSMARGLAESILKYCDFIEQSPKA